MFLKVLLALVIAAEFVTVPLFLKHYWPDRTKKSFALKVISATLFVACGFIAMGISGNTTSYAILMMIGLFLGFVGDVFLHSIFGKKWHFPLGFVAFLIGHFFYIAAFWKAIQASAPDATFFTLREIIATLVIVGIIVVVLISTRVFKGKEPLIAAFLVYGLILFTMLVKAFTYALGEIALYGTNNRTIAVCITVAFAALLFTISDLILGYTIPKGSTKRITRIVNIVTYFTAQILLGLSILYVTAA